MHWPKEVKGKTIHWPKEEKGQTIHWPKEVKGQLIFLLCLSLSCVLCSQYCQFLWIVHSLTFI